MLDQGDCRRVLKEARRIESYETHTGSGEASGRSSSYASGLGKESGLTKEEVFELGIESGFAEEPLRKALRRWEKGAIDAKPEDPSRDEDRLAIFGGAIEVQRYSEEKCERLLRDVWWRQQVRVPHGETTRRPTRPLTSAKMRDHRNKTAAIGAIVLIASVVAGFAGLIGGWVTAAGLLMCTGIGAKVYRAEKLACELEDEDVQKRHADLVKNYR